MTSKKLFQQFNYKTSIAIRFRDVDAFGHVNNAVFLTYFEIARTRYWKDVINWDWNEMGIIIAKAEIDYVKPVLLDDEIAAYVRTARVGKSSFDIDYAIVKSGINGDEICASGKTVCVSYDYSKNVSAPIPEIYMQKMVEFEEL